MALSVDEVRKIAALAKLRLTPEEEEIFVPQLRQIVEYVDQLKAFSVAPEAAEATPGMEAEDRPRGSMPREEFLANAPQSRAPFLVVPQVKVTGDE